MLTTEQQIDEVQRRALYLLNESGITEDLKNDLCSLISRVIIERDRKWLYTVSDAVAGHEGCEDQCGECPVCERSFMRSDVMKKVQPIVKY